MINRLLSRFYECGINHIQVSRFCLGCMILIMAYHMLIPRFLSWRNTNMRCNMDEELPTFTEYPVTSELITSKCDHRRYNYPYIILFDEYLCLWSTRINNRQALSNFHPSKEVAALMSEMGFYADVYNKGIYYYIILFPFIFRCLFFLISYYFTHHLRDWGMEMFFPIVRIYWHTFTIIGYTPYLLLVLAIDWGECVNIAPNLSISKITVLKEETEVVMWISFYIIILQVLGMAQYIYLILFPVSDNKHIMVRAGEMYRRGIGILSVVQWIYALFVHMVYWVGMLSVGAYQVLVFYVLLTMFAEFLPYSANQLYHNYPRVHLLHKQPINSVDGMELLSHTQELRGELPVNELGAISQDLSDIQDHRNMKLISESSGLEVRNISANIKKKKKRKKKKQ